MEEIYTKYNVPENVKLLGDVPNASKYIHLCDLFVLLSNFEGLPMTIIEAMSQRKAVVASNVGGIYELVDDSNGKLVQNNVEEVSKAISEILNDEALRTTMEIASYSKFQENFTLQKMWTGYKTIYKKLLSK
jgi:glycosyltransferase involved in cell wall biosynthesis